MGQTVKVFDKHKSILEAMFPVSSTISFLISDVSPNDVYTFVTNGALFFKKIFLHIC